MILELKAHSNKKRETKAVQGIVAMVKKMGLENRMEYITFSLHAMKEFIRLAPAGTPVYYLNGELSPKELKELGAAGLDYHMGVIKKHPEWIKEAHDLGESQRMDSRRSRRYEMADRAKGRFHHH